ncbi:MAG: competence/damage-inducible protein A [Bryobacterales bacterium]|nr:competence/damage-inducible protein A [Bryobacterales bacterium]MDE0260909.1 competence/damage-inducible protein A [Bryobacterales bacterium]
MQAEVIAVGSELLTPSKLDTNSLYLARKLSELGIALARKAVVGDDRASLAEEIRRARRTSDLVILSGGLGPTLDDLTREASSDATGRALVLDESVVDEIRERFRRFQRPMAEVNRRQAYVLDGALKLDNPRGTAPGQWLEDDDGILILLPGPPRELEPMFAEACLPLLASHAPSQRFFTLVLRVAGIGESDLEQRIAPLYAPCTEIATTILSSPGDVQVHLRGQGNSEAEAQAAVQGLGEAVRNELGDAIYSEDGRPLAETVAALLARGGAKLAVAESCTGGLLAAALTAVAGSSEFFAGSVVSYCDSAKSGWLGVDESVLRSHGAVSQPVAMAMAAAARERAAGALGEPAMGVSVTGYAGPGGGTDADPVGTVYFAVADANGTRSARRVFGRGRARVRTLAVQTALDILRRRISGLEVA